MTKKGVDLSMNVIIIAAIALLVLVVITVLVLRSAGDISQGTGCAGVGGICADECEDGEVPHLTESGVRGGCLEGEKCCVPL